MKLSLVYILSEMNLLGSLWSYWLETFECVPLKVSNSIISSINFGELV